MEFKKRVQDVGQVFDSRWKANHGYQERKEFLDGRKQHFNKMYNIQDKDERKKEFLRASSVDGQVQRLSDKMNAADAGNRMGKMIDFKNNFR